MGSELVAKYPPWLVCRCPQGIYYSNEQTGETTWQAPTEVSAAMGQQPPVQAQAPQQQAQPQAQPQEMMQQQQQPLMQQQQPMMQQQQPQDMYAQQMAMQQQQQQQLMMQQQQQQQLMMQQMMMQQQQQFMPQQQLAQGVGGVSAMGLSGRRKGKLNTFLQDKGWGFIESGDGGRDIFLHFSRVTNSTKEELAPGMWVEYDVEDDVKSGRLKAVNATVVK
eukprot:gnl/TRDRNA2_/TRDRNA2_165032_c1_seq4.p1 gnl/TRDRNA2_/TRDRNA2_165032_c1~~gnl/TRDRNA2_/TRDRNA2_165032_c1_seq4.p1  ORF type:complete len:220 (-),score=78.68 gnl/TRDRNA2_/TRDRNA2_165032_c1_seq4:41-700(-)